MSSTHVRLEVFLPAVDEAPPAHVASLSASSPADVPQQVELADGSQHALHRNCITAQGGLNGCVACGHPELFTQKDFPRAAGLTIVVVAALLAPFTYYLSLVAAAVVDALLYRLAPDVVTCYVCSSAHRGFPIPPKHPRFNLEIAERLRYGKRAVMGKPMRPGGTANAPEPEH